MSGPEGFAAVRLSPGSPDREARARYDSGLTIHEEALVGGRWVGRYWCGNGFPETEQRSRWVSRAALAPQETAGIDLASFGLEMDGQSLHWGWELEGMEETPAGRAGSRAAAVRLRSTLLPVSLTVHTEVDGTGFLCRRLSITNTGPRPAALGHVWVWSGLLVRTNDWQALLGGDGPAFHLGSMTERNWAREGSFDWTPLPSTPVRIEGRNGRSGHGTPFFVVRCEASGEHVVGGLAWSANWAVELTSEQLRASSGSGGDAFLAFRMGPVAPSPQRVLAPAETVDTPPAHLGLLKLDFDASIQTWHRHLRRSVLQPEVPGREGLVIVNHWSYHQHEFTEGRLDFEVDVAAEVGAELFIVDAGWFGNQGTEWWKTAGDWQAGDRLPRGLGPVFDRAHAKGLLCGLWLDLERMGEESQAAREHPEWLLSRYGRPSAGGDMDLTNPEAIASIERTLVRVIESLGLDLFRLDLNTFPWEGGQVERDGRHENTAWRYYEGVYALYERIRARYPRLIMENCAGGGGRADLGMVSRFSHTWVTDWPKMPRWARILNGMTMALPPERIDRCAGVAQGAHELGDLATHLRASMFSRLTLSGLYPGPGLGNADLVAEVKRFVAFYKSFARPLLADCLVFHHTPVLRGVEPEGWAVLEYASPDASRALVGLFRLAGRAPDEHRLRLRGIDPGRRYRVGWDSTRKSAIVEGAALAGEGLPVRLEVPLTSEMLTFEAVS
jgi:alpha-galactosidase